MNNKKSIVLIDGDCSFCSASAQFIIKRDPKKQFLFASLHSKIGKELQKKFNKNETGHSVVLIIEDKYYEKSDAALRIAQKLNSPLKLSGLFLFIPQFIRDIAYSLIAKSRRLLPGKEYCDIQLENSERFLDL